MHPLSTSGLVLSTWTPRPCDNRRRARRSSRRPRTSCASRSDSFRGGARRSPSASAGSTTGWSSSSARRAREQPSLRARSARSWASSTSVRSRRSRPRWPSSPRFRPRKPRPSSDGSSRSRDARARGIGQSSGADPRDGIPRTCDPASRIPRLGSSISFATAATSSARSSRNHGFAASRPTPTTRACRTAPMRGSGSSPSGAQSSSPASDARRAAWVWRSYLTAARQR